jgi:hypothetical protein
LTRLTGLIAAVLFGVVSLRIFGGNPLTPIAAPLPMYAYPVLVLTFIGWIVAIVRHAPEAAINEATVESRTTSASV